MADKSRSAYRALGLQDPRLTFWSAESSLTQAGPRPGVPEPQNDNQQMVLEASGTQSAGGEVEVLCTRGGFAEPDGAGFVWRGAGDTNYRGWDAPNVVVSYDAIAVTTSTTIQRYPHAITLRHQTDLTTNDYILMAYTGQGTVDLRQGTGSPITWSSESTLTESGSSDYHHPCLVELPSGRILLIHPIYTGSGSAKQAQIKVRYSDDQGSSWSTMSPGALDTPIDASTASTGHEIRKVRAAYANGQILLVVSLRQDTGASPATREVLAQYGSDDGGASFQLVELQDATADEQTGSHHDLVGTVAGFVVAWHEATDYTSATSTGIVRIARLGSAYEKISTATRETVNANPTANYTSGILPTDSDLAMCIDEDGAIFVNFLRNATVTFDAHSCFRSTDGGKTWATIGTHSEDGSDYTGVTFYSGVDDAHPVWSTLTAQRGRILWISNWVTINGTQPWSLTCLYLGGYSTVTMPPLTALRQYGKRVGWENNYIPYDVPDDVGWTASTTGSPTISLTSGYLSLSTDGSNHVAYTANPTGTIAEGLLVLAACEATSGTTRLICRIADGSNHYAVRVHVTSSSMTLIDHVSGSTIATTLSVSGAVQILIALGTAEVTMKWRDRDSNEDREWNQLGTSGASLTNSGTPAANHAVIFGHNGSTTGDSRWYGVHYVSDAELGTGPWSAGFTNPDDLVPRAFAGAPVYTDDGVRVTAVGGPAATDDEWHIPVRYDYAVSHVLEPSPRLTYRSTSTAQQQIAYTLGAEGDTSVGNDGLIVALLNTNVHRVTLEGYDDDLSTWDTLATLNTADGMDSLNWRRSGNGISFNTSVSGSKPYLYLNELAGATWSAGVGSSFYNRITHNHEGKWDDAATYKRPWLFLESLSSGKGSSGTSGLVMAKNAAWYVPLDGVRYSGYRLTILAPGGSTSAPAESYWEIGSLIIGPALVFGQQYSWGRTIDFERATELRETEDGTVSVRTLAPTRRTIEFGWTDGVDMSLALDPDGDPDPDFVDISTGTGHEPVATPQDTPYQLAGLVDLLEGARHPFVYLPRVAKSDSVQTFNRYHEMAYVRLAGPIAVETAWGDELEDEVVRTPSMILREEL